MCEMICVRHQHETVYARVSSPDPTNKVTVRERAVGSPPYFCSAGFHNTAEGHGPVDQRKAQEPEFAPRIFAASDVKDRLLCNNFLFRKEAPKERSKPAGGCGFKSAFSPWRRICWASRPVHCAESMTQAKACVGLYAGAQGHARLYKDINTNYHTVCISPAATKLPITGATQLVRVFLSR